MALVDGRLFVTVQRLDRRRGFAPTGPSRLVVIDTATDAVVGEIVLPRRQPVRRRERHRARAGHRAGSSSRRRATSTASATAASSASIPSR